MHSRSVSIASALPTGKHPLEKQWERETFPKSKRAPEPLPVAPCCLPLLQGWLSRQAAPAMGPPRVGRTAQAEQSRWVWGAPALWAHGWMPVKQE